MTERPAASAGPRVLIVSLPKSGTHVLNSILAQFPGMRRRRGVWLNSQMRHHPINLLPWPGAETCLMGIKRPQRVKLAAARFSLRRIGPWRYASGHIPYQQNVRSLIDALGIKPLFIIRDPRDVLVSSLHYATARKDHFLGSTLRSMELRDRLKAVILGGTTDAGELFTGIGRQLDLVAGWMTDPDVLALHFEKLIGVRGGGALADQIEAVSTIGAFIGLPLSADTAQRIGTAMFGKGPTFRKGAIGAWQDVFDQELTDLFDSQVGDRLARLGY